jgi:hypothetical protein
MMRGACIASLALAAAVALSARSARSEEPAPPGLPAPARGGEVEVSVAPDRLTLGEDAEARVVVALPQGALKVRMRAAAGKVRDIEVGKDGTATGTYTPPASFVPRVDVVIALVEMRGAATKVGFAAIPLTGQGEAILKTRPKAQAKIRIGVREYGPVQADKRGEARIRILVPPGTSVGLDDRNVAVDLGVPDMPRVAVFPALTKVGTDAPAAVPVYVVATGIDGAPAPAASVSLSVDRGGVSAARPIGGGAFAAEYTPPEKGTGKVVLSAVVEGDHLPAATAELTLVESAAPSGSPDAAARPDSPPERPALAHRIDAALKLGFASNLGAINTFDLGVDLAYELRLRAVGLRLGGDAGFSKSAADGSDAAGEDGSIAATTALWLVPITGYLGCRVPLAAVWSLSGRLEAGAAMLDNEIRMRPAEGPAETVHEREWLPAIGGAVELGRDLGPGAIMVEVRYLHVVREPATIAGRLGMLYANVGYRLGFDL